MLLFRVLSLQRFFCAGLWPDVFWSMLSDLSMNAYLFVLKWWSLADTWSQKNSLIFFVSFADWNTEWLIKCVMYFSVSNAWPLRLLIKSFDVLIFILFIAEPQNSSGRIFKIGDFIYILYLINFEKLFIAYGLYVFLSYGIFYLSHCACMDVVVYFNLSFITLHGI